MIFNDVFYCNNYQLWRLCYTKSILVHLYGRKQRAMQRYLKSLQMLKKLETEEVLLDLFMTMTMSRTDNMITTLQYLNQVTGSKYIFHDKNFVLIKPWFKIKIFNPMNPHSFIRVKIIGLTKLNYILRLNFITYWSICCIWINKTGKCDVRWNKP